MRMKIVGRVKETPQKHFQRISGSTELGELLNYVIKVLGSEGIKTLIIGGLAVQHYGLLRFTSDADIIVSDFQKAVKILKKLGFEEGGHGDKFQKMVDPQEGIGVDLLEPGHHDYGGVVDIPMPSELVEKPKYLDLSELLSLKISSYQRNGSRRNQDLTDVTRLIEILKLPRDFSVDSRVQINYENFWDDLNSKERSPML